VEAKIQKRAARKSRKIARRLKRAARQTAKMASELEGKAEEAFSLISRGSLSVLSCCVSLQTRRNPRA
jgi:hypothetical protein